jgi:hypothetical protein
VAEPTVRVATWADGLFAITGDRCTQEIANQRVRGLAPDGRGGALAIVGQHSLRRRAPSGEWATVATSEFELSCCMAVGDAIYAGTDDARMLRLSHERGVLDPIDGFDHIAGRDARFGLFVSESHDGIDTHGFPRRYVRREQRDGQKQQRDAGE